MKSFHRTSLSLLLSSKSLLSKTSVSSTSSSSSSSSRSIERYCYHHYHTSRACHSHDHDHDHEHHDDLKGIKLRWIKRNGTEQISYAKEGQVLLRAAQAAGIELEGACEGVCACSTCHVILPEDVYSQLSEPSEDEEDMLDQAFGLTSTSRLGCQIKLSKKDHDNILIKIPSATRNFYVDGHVPKPH